MCLQTAPAHLLTLQWCDAEGVEERALWDETRQNPIPDAVAVQLPFPDLVVVRPAPVDMGFSEFLTLLYTGQNLSAYMEYASLDQYMPEMRADILEPSIAGGLLLDQTNIWLGDGRTVGKLHFDQYENLLCQVAGEKHITLYPPRDNTALYEGHIPEAQWQYSRPTRTFRRKTLLDSTSMVMSPVDPIRPNLECFPRFATAQPVHCTIRAGDMLFLPSWWWHEVRSAPDEFARNIAVNFWYSPVFNKEFPCPECPLEFNVANYGDALDELAQASAQQP